VNAAGRHHDFVGTSDGDAVGGSKLLRKELEQARHAGGLQIVAAVFVDGAPHRGLDGIRGVEADVALVEPEGTLDRIHHVADADDAGEGDAIEIFTHDEPGILLNSWPSC